MKCSIKRNIFSLFDVYTCSGCVKKCEDEFIFIGRKVIAIYHLFDSCLNLEIDKELLVPEHEKLKKLLKDAIINQNEIFFCFLDDFRLDNYYEIFEKITDDDLSIQIITM